VRAGRLERAEHRADGKDGMKRWPVVLLAGGLAAGAAGFYASEPSRLATIIDLVARRDSIASGFVGMANFGHWRLICVRGPAPLQGLLAASAKENKSGQASGNACRVNQEIRAPGAAQETSPADVPPRRLQPPRRETHAGADAASATDRGKWAIRSICAWTRGIS